MLSSVIGAAGVDLPCFILSDSAKRWFIFVMNDGNNYYRDDSGNIGEGDDDDDYDNDNDDQGSGDDGDDNDERGDDDHDGQ
ncbi:hypothetical protein PoB_004327500 [Plakobranchus ocellatus]|uniref:Uncharacterized protein n=1 Tax=Plakobranchus ocellatus TaxID=259542 RepID=A0AAV4BCH0_9GAST|nr:hypothetical protein PoB_004327500 [Plakobranchus ocellatus]